ncbi:hypothetical protein [uncultured Senegalimassilia sp.]|uniref:hypothetical protein n=1 Tax=uncultured Senegalimassilia sp. TaxID=1714350 RepID=UPI0025E9BD3D|nr:hypothetical protein [uncultured Senegalimassilia sp.]
MAHMQENPQTAGKDTKAVLGGETRQMPLRADRPARAAQAPYPLQGRPAPTQRVATPFAAPGGNGANGIPGANAAAAVEVAEADEAPKRKGLGGLLEGLSVPQVAAGALAAVTSMLLSSKIGIAGSVIGVAVGSVVSTVASQVYKQFLQASADKLRELSPLDEAGLSAAAGETRVMPAAGEGFSATRVMGAVPASGDHAAADGPAASATPTRSVRDLRESGETGVLRGRAEHLRRRRMQRGVIAVSVVSALAAVAISAGIINLVTAGEGVGTKTEPLFTGASTSQTDDGSTTKGKQNSKSQQSATQSEDSSATKDSAAPVHQDGTASPDSSASGSSSTGGSSTSGTESGSASGTGSSTGSTTGGTGSSSGSTSGSQTGGSGSGSGGSSTGSSTSGSTGTESSSSTSGSTGSTGNSSSGSSTSGFASSTTAS